MMKTRPACLITNRDNAILTMCYQYGSTTVYVLPGGNPDPGETLSDALKRELWEELSVHAEIGNLVLAGEVVGFPNRSDTLHCIFRADIGDQIPQINPLHTSAKGIVWLTSDRLQHVTLYPNFSVQLLEPSPSFHYAGLLQQPYHE